MCEICGWRICPPSCPSYDGRDAERGYALGRCAMCGAFLYEDNDFFAVGVKLECACCHSKRLKKTTKRYTT